MSGLGLASAVSALAGTTAYSSTTPAMASPTDQILCNFDTVSMQFNGYPDAWVVNTIYGPYNYRTDWLAGAALWDQIQQPAGGAWTSSGLGNTVPVTRAPQAGNGIGETTCYPDGSLYMNLADNVPIGPMVRAIGVHETGHAHHMEHSGRNDSMGNLPPAMATCVLSNSTNAIQHVDRTNAGTTRNGSYQTMQPSDYSQDLSADDYSYLARNHPNNNTVTANASFENGLKFWKAGNANAAVLGSDNTGPYALAFASKTPGQQSNMSQMVRQEHNGNLNARVNYRMNPGTTGTVSFKVSVRGINYDVDNDPNDGYSCPLSNFVNGYDLNLENYTGYWFDIGPAAVVHPGVSWNFSDLQPGANSAINGWRSADISLTIYNDTTGAVGIDYARVYNS